MEGRTPQVKALNVHLDNVVFKLKEKYRQMVDKDLPVDAQAIKDAFLGKQAEAKGHTLCELVSYHYHMEGEKLTWGTMKNYKAIEEYLKRYIKKKYKKEDLPLKKLDYEFILEFESFIRNYPLKSHDRCVGNGVMKHLERLKKMIRWEDSRAGYRTTRFLITSSPSNVTKERSWTLRKLAGSKTRNLPLTV